jgi:hypothetical protein
LLGIDSDPPQNPRLAPVGTPLFQSRFGNFAPRLGAAYQVGRRQGWETTLRGGAGIFYDLPLGFIADAFQNIYPFFASKFVCCNLAFPLSEQVRTPPVLGIEPPDHFDLLDPHLKMPYTVQWNGTWEQGIGSAQSVTISYVGAVGHRLLVLQNRFVALADWPQNSLNLNVQRNLARSNYTALQVQYKHSLRNGLQGLLSYTLGRSRDNVSSDSPSTTTASTADLLTREYGPSDFDVRHVLSAALTYEVPRFTGPPLLKLVSTGWGLDLLIRYQSAGPINPRSGFVFLPDGTQYFPRPDAVPGQPLYIYDPTVPGGRRFNRAAFTTAAAGQQGNFPRNGLRGFPASQVDLALRREFKLLENVRLQLRGELFNIFNHPNFGAPESDLSNGLFGQPRQMLNKSLGGLNALYQLGGPRSGQFAIKLIF